MMLKQFLIDVRVRLLALFGRHAIQARAEEEAQFHLAMLEERLMESGVPPGEARLQARRQFGNPTVIQERTVDAWRYASLDALVQDIRYGLRLFTRRPGFAALVTLTLALGIGANTAVFSIVNAVLLQPLTYREPSRLVIVYLRNVRETGTSKMFSSARDYRAFAQARSFELIAAATWATGGRLLKGWGPAREILAMPASESFFSLLGVAPALGRTFLPGDAQRGGCSVVLSDRLWRSVLGADSTIAGKRIVLDDRSCNVLGVMPPSFTFYPVAAQAWILITPDFVPPLDQMPLGVFARLRPGVTIAQAQTELTALHSALNKGDGQERDLEPLVADLHGEFTFLAEARLRATLWMLTGAVALVLLIVCLNVANLLLGQGLGRRSEFAARAALGCGRARLVRQLLTEGLMLSALGGVAGIGVAIAAVGYFRTALPVELPPGADVRMSWPVLAFSIIISLSSALLSGVLPAWRASRGLERLRAGRNVAQAAPTVLQWIIAAEMALSLILLAGSGLLMRSVFRLGSEQLGFESRGLNATALKLPAENYRSAASRLQFYDRALEAVGGESAISTALPPFGWPQSARLHIPGSEDSESNRAGYRSISPGYFRVMGERMLLGREFSHQDLASSTPVVIVNETLTRRYFPGVNAIGQRIALGTPSDRNPWRTIAGVVADEKGTGGLDTVGWGAMPGVYKPLAQDPPQAVFLVTRGSGSGFRRAVGGIDGEVAISEVESMERRLDKVLAYPRFRATVLGWFAVFAVTLAAIGLYGVLGQFVSQRTPEIGIRVAMGAGPWDILKLVSGRAGAPLIAGLVLGLLGAAALSRLIANVLYGVKAGDPATLAASSLALIAAGASAAYVPVRRALRIDPIKVLRAE